MKNLKKYLAGLVAALMLTATAIPAGAADATYTYSAEATTLNTLGLYSGVSTTTFDADLGTAVNREVGLTVIIKLLGKADDAQALTDADVTAQLAKFTDAAKISDWAKKYVAYAVKSGLSVGEGATWGPQNAMLGKQVATIVLKSLGYTPNYDTAAAELANAKGLTSVQALKFNDKELIKDDLVGIAYGTLKAVDSKGTTVIASLVASKDVDAAKAVAAGLVTAATPAPNTLKVASVTADNLKNIIVKFETAVKSASVTTSTVKVYNGTTLLSITPVVLDDNMTVVLPHGSNYDQMKDYKVVVDGVVSKDSDTVKATGYEKTINISDVVAPNVVDVAATSPKTVVITFSEPVQTGAAAGQFPTAAQVLSVVQVDGINLYASNIDITELNTKNKISLTLGTGLTVGAHKIKVTGVKDFATFPIAEKTFDVTIAADTAAPKVTAVKMTSTTSVEITFDEPVDNATVQANLANITVDGVAITAATPKSGNVTYTATLGGALGKAALVEAVLSYKGVKDFYGNAVTDATTFNFKVEDDTTAPTVSGVTVNSDNTFEMTVSEDVTIAASAFELYDKDNNKLSNVISYVGKTIDGATSKKVFTITVTGGTSLSGAHTLKLLADKVVDLSVRGNKVPAASFALTLNDKVPPQVSKIEVVNESTVAADKNSDGDQFDSKVTIYFNEAMDNATLSNKANYIVGGTLVSESSNITVTPAADNKSVVLDINRTAAGSVVIGTNMTTNAGASTSINVLAVKDTAGNVLAAAQMNAALYAVDYSSTFAAAAVASVQATAKNTLKVTMNSGNLIKSVDPNKFAFGENDNDLIPTLQVMSVAIASDATYATLTLNNNLSADSMYDGSDADTTKEAVKLYSTADGAITLTNDAGLATTAVAAGLVVADKTKPTIQPVSSKFTATGTNVALVFDETVTALSNQALATALTVKDSSGNVLVPNVDYTASASGTTVTVTIVKVGFNSKVTIALANNATIKDASTNYANDFAATESDVAVVATNTGVTYTTAESVAGVTANAGTPEVNRITFTAPVAAVAGDLTVTFTDGTTTVSKTVTLAGAETTAQVATAVEAAFNGQVAGYTTAVVGSAVQFTNAVAAADKAVVITVSNATTTTVVATASQTTAGVAPVTGVAEQNTLTITGVATGAGNIVVTYANGTATATKTVAVTTSMTTANIATAIAAAGGWTGTGTVAGAITGVTVTSLGAVVTFVEGSTGALTVNVSVAQ